MTQMTLMTLAPAVIQDCRQKLQQALNETNRDQAEILEALKRMEQGNYGVCPDCSDQIQPARLQSLPTAKRCVRCESNNENKLQQEKADRLARNTVPIRC